jgi:hypothetical protein
VLGFALIASGNLCAATRYLVLPMELETDRGAANGDASFLRLMPAYNWKINDDWQVVNLDLILLANAPGGVPGLPGTPNPLPGDRARGLSDWIHASFFNPVKTEGVVVGFGFIAGVPTATDPVLGSEKWTIGPALRVNWRQGSWLLGAFGGQRWSYAGNSNRADVNQLMIRGTVIYEPPGDWFLVSAPIITANWDAKSGERWLLPVGGGVGRRFGSENREWRASVQFYSNVVKPDGAPDWTLRLGLTAVIPF